MNPNKDEKVRETIPDGLGLGKEPEADKSPPPQQEPEQTPPEADPFDIDALARETDEKFKIPGDEDKFEDDLGWGGAPEKEQESDEKADPDKKDDEPGQESEGKEEDKEETEDKPSDHTSTDQEEPGDEDERGTEDEPYYSEERDFPAEDGKAKVAGTIYKDRVKLNDGVAAKINHARNLKKQLEENKAGLGAIRLPELFEGDETFIDRPFDRTTFAETDDEGAKKAAYELDRFIKDVNGKLDKVQQTRQQQQQMQQVSEEYKNAVVQLEKDIDLMGMDLQQANSLKLGDLFSKIDSVISEFEGDKGQEYVDEHGAKEYYNKMRRLEDARDRIRKFPEVAKKQQQASQPAQKPSVADPEQVKAAFLETRQDRPDHPVFESKQKENSFLEWIENEIYQGNKTPAESPREWVKYADEYEELVKKEYARYESQKSKSEPASSKDQDKNKPEPRADRSNKNKPAPSDISTDKKHREGGDRLTVDEIDAEMERLAKETEHRLNT